MTGASTPSEEAREDPPVEGRGQDPVEGNAAKKDSAYEKGGAPFEGPKGDPAEGKRR